MVTSVANTFAIVQIVLATMIALFAFIYSLPILCIHRFHHRNNVFTLNVCLTTILCAVTYGVIFIRPLLGYPSVHFIREQPWFIVVQVFLGTSLMLSFVLVAFHRCCSIVFQQKRFFRTKQWVMVCLAGEWTLAAMICIPFFVDPKKVRLALMCPSVNIVHLLEYRLAVGTISRVRQHLHDAVSDLSCLERADLLSRSCIVTSSPNRDGPFQRSRKKHQPSRPAPPATHGHHVLGLLDGISAVISRSHSQLLQANRRNTPSVPLDLV